MMFQVSRPGFSDLHVGSREHRVFALRREHYDLPEEISSALSKK
jgi:hypothetical protein